MIKWFMDISPEGKLAIRPATASKPLDALTVCSIESKYQAVYIRDLYFTKKENEDFYINNWVGADAAQSEKLKKVESYQEIFRREYKGIKRRENELKRKT